MAKTDTRSDAVEARPERKKRRSSARSKPRSLTRARVAPADRFVADPGTRRERVAAIADLMTLGLWERGKTGRELAAAWKLSVGTLKHMASEASRLVDVTTGQRSRLLDFSRHRLLEIARENGNDRVPALRTMLEHLGELRQRHLVTPARDPVSEMTDQELKHYVATGEMPARLKGGTEA